jgi:hypothetical protein
MYFKPRNFKLSVSQKPLLDRSFLMLGFSSGGQNPWQKINFMQEDKKKFFDVLNDVI